MNMTNGPGVRRGKTTSRSSFAQPWNFSVGWKSRRRRCHYSRCLSIHPLWMRPLAPDWNVISIGGRRRARCAILLPEYSISATFAIESSTAKQQSCRSCSRLREYRCEITTYLHRFWIWCISKALRPMRLKYGNVYTPNTAEISSHSLATFTRNYIWTSRRLKISFFHSIIIFMVDFDKQSYRQFLKTEVLVIRSPTRCNVV